MAEFPPPESPVVAASPPPPRARKYRGFLSYSHHDKPAARRLHRQIERYRFPRSLRNANPTIPRSVKPIFRDEDDLSTANSLTEAIRTALDESDALIVVCTPAAATRSKWMNLEIEHFVENDRAEDIYLVLHQGTPLSGGADECYPPAVKALFVTNRDGLPEGPLAADGRGGRRQRREGLLRLLSGLVGADHDDLARRDFRRRRRVGVGLTAVSVVIAAVMIGLAVRATRAADEERRQRAIAQEQAAIAEEQTIIADEQRLIAEGERDVAEQRALEAKIRELSRLAIDSIERQPRLAALLALEAEALASSSPNVDEDLPYAALYAVASTPRPHELGADLLDEVSSVFLGPTGGVAVVSGPQGTLIEWIDDGNAAVELLSVPIDTAQFSRDGSLILTSGSNTTSLWRLDGSQLASVPTVDSSSAGAASNDIDVGQLASWGATLSPDGTRFLTRAVESNVVVRLHAADGSLLATLSHGDGPNDSIGATEFIPETGEILTAGATHLRFWTETGQLRTTVELPSASGGPVTFTDDGSLAQIGLGLVVDLLTTEVIVAERALPGTYRRVSTSEGDIVAFLADGPDFDRGELVAVDGRVLAMYPTHEGQWITDISADGTLVVSEGIQARSDLFLATGELVATMQHGEDMRAHFLPDSSSFYTWAVGSGSTRLWSRSGELLASLELPEQEDSIGFGQAAPIEVSNDGRYAWMQYSDWAWDLRPDQVSNIEQVPVAVQLIGSTETTDIAPISPDGEQVLQRSSELYDVIAQGSIVVLDADGDVNGELVHDVAIRTAIFSPDSAKIATIDYNGEVSVWTGRGQLLEQVEVRSPASSLGFDATSGWLVVVDEDGTSSVHRTWSRMDALAQARRRVGGRRLVDTECVRFELDVCGS